MPAAVANTSELALYAAPWQSYAIGAASVTYLEGYLFDPPPAREAFVRARSHFEKGGKTGENP